MIVDKYRAAAERFGYSVAGSNNSRNGPWETSVADFLGAVHAGKPCAPPFRDGLSTDYVTDAVRASARNRAWVDVAKN